MNETIKQVYDEPKVKVVTVKLKTHCLDLSPGGELEAPGSNYVW